MQSQVQWPHCVSHPDSPYQYLLLTQNCNSNRILCADCLYSRNYPQYKEEYAQTITLTKVMQCPENTINQMKKEEAKKLSGIFKICELDLEKEFKDQIQKFEILQNIFEIMKEQIRQKLKEYKDVQEILKNQQKEFLEKCNWNNLKQLINQLQEIKSQFKSDQYMQIIAKINSTIDEMTKDDCKLIKNNINQFFLSHVQLQIEFNTPKNEQVLGQIVQVFQGYSNFIEDLNKNINSKLLIPQFRILTNEFFERIQQRIEEGLKKYIQSFNLIYLGTRDGLNGDAYWSKVNGQKNLLIIMKSQINQVFGGYSPCQWEKCSGKYVKDDTLVSFLFSQTQNEIYQLNQDKKQISICLNQSYGPVFGGGHDMIISDDFNSGSSNLGHTYVLDQKYKSQCRTHLFGEQSPKIIECEIYEIILS